MAGYCNKCGRPLPESGVCSCETKTAGRVRMERSVDGFLKLWIGCLKDPVGAACRSAERRDFRSGLTLLLASVAVSLLSVLVLTLRYAAGRIARAAVQWLVTGLFAPVIAAVLTFLLIYALTAMARMRVDVRSVVAAIGVSAVLPMAVMTLSVVLSLFHQTVFTVFCAVSFAAWAFSFFLLVTQVFNIRITPAVCAVTVGGMTAGYFAVALLRDWMLAALF